MTQLKKQAVLALFGSDSGTKLINWLNPCCPAFCEAVTDCNASQPFAIGANLQCIPTEQMNVTLSVTYNQNITGITSVDFIATTTDPTIGPTLVNDTFSGLLIPSATSGVTYTASFITGSGTGQTRYIIGVDSHGNYSNVLTVVIPSCP